MRERHEPVTDGRRRGPPLGTAGLVAPVRAVGPVARHASRWSWAASGWRSWPAPWRSSWSSSAIAAGGVRWSDGCTSGRYQLRFDEIDPRAAAPGLVLRGRAGFLDGVRRTRGDAESLSVLDVDLESSRHDFRHYAWVKKVSRGREAGPNRIVVRLDYREPVAHRAERPRRSSSTATG